MFTCALSSTPLARILLESRSRYSAVFQKAEDHPNEYAAGYHVVLDGERMLRVRWDQVAKR